MKLLRTPLCESIITAQTWTMYSRIILLTAALFVSCNAEPFLSSRGFSVRGGATPRFSGEVKTLWILEEGTDRTMELMDSFSFIDKNGKKWTAPKGTHVDGATIPRFFWRFVGSPFVGDYRRASVIHDFYCYKENQHLTKTSKEVHDMFKEACIADGVGKRKADIMYKGIVLGGPKWKNE